MLKQRRFSDGPSNPKFLRSADENQSGVLSIVVPLSCNCVSKYVDWDFVW